jgi:hypothetical protein
MRGSEHIAASMPRLDAFDEEFGREPVAMLRGQRRKGIRLSALVGAALGAAIITALAWPWVQADGGLRSELQSLFPGAAPRDGSTERIEQLVREVESLKQQIAELTEARQQAMDRIASLETAEQATRDSASVYWYSDLAALSYGMATASRPVAGVPLAPRRSATARPDGRAGPENSAPLSLEPPQ